jgi:hypothetical protein
VAEAAFEQWRRASGCQGASRRYLARVRTEGVGCGLLRRSSPSLGMIAISWRYRVRLERILIRYRGLSAVRTGVSPGRRRASGTKGCVLTARPEQRTDAMPRPPASHATNPSPARVMGLPVGTAAPSSA